MVEVWVKWTSLFEVHFFEFKIRNSRARTLATVTTGWRAMLALFCDITRHRGLRHWSRPLCHKSGVPLGNPGWMGHLTLPFPRNHWFLQDNKSLHLMAAWLSNYCVRHPKLLSCIDGTPDWVIVTLKTKSTWHKWPYGRISQDQMFFGKKWRSWRMD